MIASLATKFVPNVPVVIFEVAKSGISLAARVDPAVTKPLADTVTFGYVPAVTPLSATDKTPVPETVKGAEDAGTDKPPIVEAVAVGKSDAIKAAVDVINP